MITMDIQSSTLWMNGDTSKWLMPFQHFPVTRDSRINSFSIPMKRTIIIAIFSVFHPWKMVLIIFIFPFFFSFYSFISFFFYVQEAVNMKNISIPYEEKKSVCHEGKKLPQKEENAFKQAIVRRFTSVRPLMRQSSRSATRTRTTRRDCVCATRFWQLSPIVVVCWRNTVFMPSSLA